MDPRTPPAPARWIVAVTARLVPRAHRDRFRRQWHADLVHRWRATVGDDEGWASTATVIWALGAFPHAGYLVRREWKTMMGDVMTDLRQAARALRRHGALSFFAIGVLTLGIGTVVALFSIAEVLLFRPLPLPEGDRLVSVYSSSAELGFDRASVSYPNFLDYLDSGVLDAGAIYVEAVVDLAGEVEPERIAVTRVGGGGFFETTGAQALVGRLLNDSDFRAGSPRTLVLSEALWTRRYGRDPDVLGRTVRLDGRPHTLIGVVRSEHQWPVDGQAWTALNWGGSPPDYVMRRSNRSWATVARLAPGVAPDHAEIRLNEILDRINGGAPDDEVRDWRARVVPLHRSMVPGFAQVLFALMGISVAGVLLIACMNVASLLLVHASRRVRDLSLRSALGASRGRILRQLMAESLILAMVGGAAGTGLAAVLVRLAATSAPAEIQRLEHAGLSLPAIAVALGATLLSAVVAGLVPGLQASRPDVSGLLGEGGKGASSGRSRRRGQRFMVAAEVALSTVLLVGASLMIRSFQSALASDPGFREEGLLTFMVGLPEGHYTRAETRVFYDRAVEALASVSGVRSASVTSRLPLGGGGTELFRAFLPEGAPEPPAGPEFTARWIEVGPEYFRTLDVAPVRGRTFSGQDGPDTEPVMVVSEAMARSLTTPGEEILGRRVRSWRDEDVLRTVVGVVPAIRAAGMGREDPKVVYVPRSQSARWTMAFVVRTGGSPTALVAPVRAVMQQLDPDLALDRIATLEDVHRRALAPIRFVTSLFSFFGVVALVLAVTGLYGLVAVSTTARTRELGIRVAVGASRSHVTGLVLREGLLLTATGLVAGGVAALGFARVLQSVLDQVGWLDPLAWGAVLGLLGAAAVAASLVPALRAASVDPVRVLNAE